MTNTLQQFFVKKIYADHNDSAAVKDALAQVLAEFPSEGSGLKHWSWIHKFWTKYP